MNQSPSHAVGNARDCLKFGGGCSEALPTLRLLAASRFIDLIEQKCYLLADNPKIGRQRNELAAELRSFPVKSYVIYYRCRERGIEIIRILSSAKDIDSIWF